MEKNKSKRIDEVINDNEQFDEDKVAIKEKEYELEENGQDVLKLQKNKGKDTIQ